MILRRLFLAGTNTAASFGWLGVRAYTSTNSDPRAQQQQQQQPRGFVPWPFAWKEIIELKVEMVAVNGMGVGWVDGVDVGAVQLQQQQRQQHKQDQNPAVRKRRRESRKQKSKREQKAEEAADALAALRLDSRSGWPVLVPFTIPGEVVEVEVHGNMDTYTKAKLLRIVSAPSSSSSSLAPPSTMSVSVPQRVEPRCKAFGECSGCQYQHIELSVQREWKMTHVVEAMEDCFELDRQVVAGVRAVLFLFKKKSSRGSCCPHLKSNLIESVACQLPSPFMLTHVRPNSDTTPCIKGRSWCRPTLLLPKQADATLQSTPFTTSKWSAPGHYSFPHRL